MMRNICVIGSCSMDLVVTSDKRPKAGETVLGTSFQTVPGGKGANQAVVCCKTWRPRVYGWQGRRRSLWNSHFG